MNHITEDIILHYGMPRRSGRYPFGSGDNPYQHSVDFLSRIEKLKKQGWTETPENIEKEFGITTTQYRREKSYAKDERRMLDGYNKTVEIEVAVLCQMVHQQILPAVEKYLGRVARSARDSKGKDFL